MKQLLTKTVAGVEVDGLIRAGHSFGEIRVPFSRFTDCRLSKLMTYELILQSISHSGQLGWILDRDLCDYFQTKREQHCGLRRRQDVAFKEFVKRMYPEYWSHYFKAHQRLRSSRDVGFKAFMLRIYPGN